MPDFDAYIDATITNQIPSLRAGRETYLELYMDTHLQFKVTL